MRQLYGQSSGPMVLVHGGAGGQDPRSPGSVEVATVALKAIAEKAVSDLAQGHSIHEVALGCLKAMELDPQFNAGMGSALQADMQIRMTAAYMDGGKQTFSGVIGVTNVLHPSEMALALQSRRSRVLTAPGTDLLARSMELMPVSCVTDARLKNWLAQRDSKSAFDCDTVGVIIRGRDGRLVAGTSTGGRGFEFPGRVSDSSTVAGTYASGVAAVSATGVGEEIVDDALAARLETRCRDGLSLEQASRRCFDEATTAGRSYGWIVLDRSGAWGVAYTTAAMTFAVAGPGLPTVHS